MRNEYSTVSFLQKERHFYMELKNKEKVKEFFIKKRAEKEARKQAKLEEEAKGRELTEQLEREKEEDWKILCERLNLKFD